MEDPLYREVILDLWQNPQNYGVLESPDLDVNGNNPLCGDQIRITGKIQSGRLVDIAFSAEGCAISKASASLFTERVKGMAIADVLRIGPDEVTDELGVELTPARTKCALLVRGVLLSGLV